MNLEQANHTIDGWVDNRKNIVEEHLPLYDSQCRDIIDQLAGQGINIEFEENDVEETDDFQEARESVSRFVTLIHASSMDPMERRILLDELNTLNNVIFGTDLEKA